MVAEDVMTIAIEEAAEDALIVMIAAVEEEMTEVVVGIDVTPETEIAEDEAGPTPATKDVIVAAATPAVEDEAEARTGASPAAAVR